MLERGYQESLDHHTSARSIALVVVIALATVIGLEAAVGAWLDRHGTNLGYRYIAHKWRVLDELEAPVDWVVLGDSSLSQAFDPEVLAAEHGKTAVNLGTIGNFGVTGDLWMLEEYIERFGAPERVVLVHAYDVWHRPLDRALIGRIPRSWVASARIRKRYKINGDELVDLLTNRWARLYAERKSIRKALELAWWKLAKDDDELAEIRAADRELPRTEPVLEPSGFVRMCDPIPGLVAGDARSHRKFLAKNTFGLSRDNRDALVRIAKLATEKGFELDIVPGPLYRGLAVEDELGQYLDATAARLRGLVRDHAGVTVHRELRTYDRDQMQNADHITCDAAPDYTRWLIDRVEASREVAPSAEAAAVVSIDCGFTTDHCRPTPDDSKAARIDGPFTLVAEVRLDGRPVERAPALARWRDADNNRAWELGIDERQRPYVALSSDGKLDRNLSGFARAAQELRLGATHELAAVIVPGREVVLYVDGVEVHRQKQVVASVHLGAATLGVRRRTSADEPSTDVIVGRARIFAKALTKEEVLELAAAREPRAPLSTLPPMRALTTGPRFHWFGYYDKHQFDPTDRYVLGMAVDFENRLVKPDDKVEIGMIDLQADDEWVRLGESRAWNWQQGCMLQWIPGTADEVVWNDRIGEGKDARFVARILDVGSRTERLLPRPIYTMTPDGKRALSIDFERLGRWRPTYGYVGARDRTQGVVAPTDAGIYAMDMTSGDSELIVSLAQIVAEANPTGAQPQEERFVEMLQINDEGTRFLFYERWVLGRTNLEHRVFTADLDGSDLFMVSHKSMLSHVDWLDNDHFVVFSGSYGGYALFEDKVGYVSLVLKTGADGHQTFLRSGAWMLADTYADRYGLQHPFLFHRPTEEFFGLAHLFSPPEYKGIFRADTHPRLSRDERRVVLDSPHIGGRQMYMIEIGEILDGLALD